MSNPSFIAFASHPALRQRYLDARPMLAIDTEDGLIAWANDSGARVFGFGSVTKATGAAIADSVTRRQFMTSAERLQQPGDSESLTIHVMRHFRREAKRAEASLFTLGGKRYYLFECDGDGPDEESLVRGPDDTQLALVNGHGMITRHSPAFPTIGLVDSDIMEMIEALDASAESFAERLITNESGIWPVEIGRLSSVPPCTLICVSPDLAAEYRPQPAVNPATGQRTARDAIAAIDESLGALLKTDGARHAAAGVVRKQTAAPKTAPVPTAEPVAEPAAQAAPAPPPETAPATETPTANLPLRFVWRTDIEGRVTEISSELVEAVGEETGAIKGLTFSEIETRLGVKGAGAIGGLLESTETWSGRTVEWPLSGTDMLVPVDLAALPTFTRERRFDGFRGFGLVRLGEERHQPPPAPPVQADKEPAREEAERESPAAALTADERLALHEIANRLRSENPDESPTTPPAQSIAEPETEKPVPVIRRTTIAARPTADPEQALRFDNSADPVVVQAGERVLYANRAFLALSGYGTLDAVIAAGGTDAFVERGSDDRLFLRRADGTKLPVSFHMQAIGWNNGRALALTLRPEDDGGMAPVALPVRETISDQDQTQTTQAATTPVAEVAQLSSILDTATDGIIIVDASRCIRSLSASAAALFATDTDAVAGLPVDVLFAEESHDDINSQITRLQRNKAGNVGAEGLEVIGRESGGGLMPLFVTLGQLPQSDSICMVLRDITALKRREDDLRAARREARQAEEEREDFIAALRYEVRQPLDAIVSLSETMDHKPFGSMGDDRYHAIAREIAGKGRQARGVIGRLLGEPEPKPQIVPVEPEPKSETRPEHNKTTRINDAIAEAVSMVQPLANSRRIIIRAALSPTVGLSAVPFETIREIAHHLLLGAVQFTPAGGQVVVSTALTDDGATVLRFRDNGIAPARRRAGNGGQRLEHDEQDNTHMGKARKLTEGLDARLMVHAVPNEGMLVEVFLPESQPRPLHY